MKYIIRPFVKILFLIIVIIWKTIISLLLTICWGILTLLMTIGYTLGIAFWIFKIKTLKLNRFKVNYYNKEICAIFIFGEENLYNSFFHAIWGIKTSLNQHFNKLINKLTINTN